MCYRNCLISLQNCSTISLSRGVCTSFHCFISWPSTQILSWYNRRTVCQFSLLSLPKAEGHLLMKHSWYFLVMGEVSSMFLYPDLSQVFWELGEELYYQCLKRWNIKKKSLRIMDSVCPTYWIHLLVSPPPLPLFCFLVGEMVFRATPLS